MPLFGRGRPRWTVSRPASRKPVTASGVRIDEDERRARESSIRLSMPWQARAFAYYDLLGEIKYGAQFYGRLASSARLFAAEVGEDGDPVETENEDAIELFERIQDPSGGREALQAQYGRLMFLVGDVRLFVSKNEDTETEQWEILSSDELKVEGTTYLRKRLPGSTPESYDAAPDEEYVEVEDDEAVAYRIWRRHPRYSGMADSTLYGVLDLCEELVLLTQAVRARARSRLAGSGILLVNGRALPAPTNVEEGDEDPNADPFIKDLTDSMLTPLQNEGDASAVVPLVVRVEPPLNTTGGGGSLDDVMKHLQIVDPTQLYPETGLRRECIERIAIGLDMPPEILLGLADANHWSAWRIGEETWKGHGEPLVKQLCSDLTAAYYRPALKEAGLSNWQDYSISYDAAEAVTHPDRSRDAKDLFDRRSISKAALREAAAFSEEDAMPQDELDEAIGLALKDPVLATTGVPSAPTSGQPPPEPEESTGEEQAAVEPGPPEPEATAQPVTEALAARLLGASDLALGRARELAGARLRSLARRDKTLAKLIDGIPNGRVAAAIGREKAKALRAPSERDLVAGSGDLIRDAVRLAGINGDAADLLIERIEQHAARTLWDERPKPFPPAYANYVRGLAL